MNHDTKCTDKSCTASCRRRTAIEEINSYLTKEFIGPWRDIPKDECLTEARHVFNIAYKLGRESAKPLVEALKWYSHDNWEWSPTSEGLLVRRSGTNEVASLISFIAEKALAEYGEGK